MMKFLITNILLSTLCFTSQAQLSLKAVFRVYVHDVASTNFFKQNPNIERITLQYKNSNVNTLAIYSTDEKIPKNIPIETYVLTFDGDLYIFKKKYPTFIFPNASELKTKYLKQIKDVSEMDTIYNLTTTFRSDSVTHFFEFYSQVSVASNPGRIPNRPYLKEEISKLTSELEKRFKSWKPIAVHDSIIVMSGVVEKNGILTNIQLLEGKISPYSKKIISELTALTRWWPVNHAGKVLSWPVKIYIRINQDQSMKISVL